MSDDTLCRLGDLHLSELDALSRGEVPPRIILLAYELAAWVRDYQSVEDAAAMGELFKHRAKQARDTAKLERENVQLKQQQAALR